MRLPFVSRKRFREACQGEAAALRRAQKAEKALWLSYGISVEDVMTRDVKQITIWMAHAVLVHFQGDPKQLMRDEAHKALDRLMQDGPGVITGRTP